MYLSFEPKINSLRQSADSQSTKYRVTEQMVYPVFGKDFITETLESKKDSMATTIEDDSWEDPMSASVQSLLFPSKKFKGKGDCITFVHDNNNNNSKS